MSKINELIAAHSLTALDPKMSEVDADWHDLTRYEIEAPRVANPFPTRNGYRAAIHVNNATTVYSFAKYKTEVDAVNAAIDKITELTKGEIK